MSFTSIPQKYPILVRFMHWIMALIIVGLIILGYYMTPYDMDNEHLSETLYYWHKSFGLLVLFLIFGRIIVRLRSSIPEFPRGIAPYELKLAKLSHPLLYLLMLLVPLTGYLDSSAYPFSSGVHFFFFDMPDLVEKNEDLSKVMNLLHKIFAYSLLGVVVLHVAGALKHRFIDTENDVLNRII